MSGKGQFRHDRVQMQRPEAGIAPGVLEEL